MQTHRPLTRQAFGPGRVSDGFRQLPEEVAIALSYNGTTQAVMMATPGDLIDFAYGFTLTEGIAARDEIEDIQILETDLGIDLQIWLKNDAQDRQAARRRTMAGPVGCGLCGIDSLEEARRRPRVVNDQSFTLMQNQVSQAMAALTRHQPLHDITHAAHAAGFWAPTQGMVAVREDVGRHNALDAIAGWLALQPKDSVTTNDRVFYTTGRLTSEMIIKSAQMGVPIVISRSGITEMGYEIAKKLNLCTIGRATNRRFFCFTAPERFLYGVEV